MRKIIEKHPNYAVSDSGVVYRILRTGVYSPLIPDLSNGYQRVDIDGIKESIGRLVLEAFRPEHDESLRVFYIDGNTSNCDISNLVWLTPSEVQLYSRYTIEYRTLALTGR